MRRPFVEDVARKLSAAVAASLLIGASSSASALANAEPYCPQLGRVPRQMYDIKKFCALVYDELLEGRAPDRLELMERPQRNRAHTTLSPKPQKVSKPRDAVPTVKQPEAEPHRFRRRDVEPRMPGESGREAGRAPGRVLNRDRHPRADRQQRQRRDGSKPSSPMVLTSPAPSETPSASVSTSSSVPARVDAVRPRSEHPSEGMGPLGAALAFGLMLMVLSAALIGRLRSWPAQASAGSSPVGLSGGAACSDGIDVRNGEEAEVPPTVVPASAGEPAPALDCATAQSVAEPDRSEHLTVTTSQLDQPSSSPAVAEAGAEAEGPFVPGVSTELGSGFVAGAGKAKAEVLGVPRLSCGRSEVCFGRAEARELFALLALSRDGVSAEGIAETLWPGEVGGHRLESAVREINRAMRQVTGCAAGVRFVVKSGERRLLPAASFDVDFWRFDEACKLVSTAVEDVARKAALHQVLALYRGPLLAGRDDLWVLPVRQAAQRHAVNAAERLAELVRADDPGRAVDVLRLAVERLDPYSELLWCQLMSVQGELGRGLAVRRSFELLKERLAEIDAVPSAQARQVYERLLR